jgi:uncharacterized protein (DUF3820 family)
MLNFLQGLRNSKSENREPRDTPPISFRSLPEVVFTAVEEKLIRLGLDPAAHQGESDVCAVKLFRSLRKRGTNADQLISGFCQSTQAVRELMAARGRVMTFGKHRGKTVGEIPLHYLRWALRECDDMPLNLRRAMQIILKVRT